MALKPLQLLRSGDRLLDSVQSNVANALGPVTAVALLDGVALPNVPIAQAATVIPHKLGRRLTGWMVTRRRANATVWDTQDGNQSPDRTLILNASAPVVVDLWVW